MKNRLYLILGGLLGIFLIVLGCYLYNYKTEKFFEADFFDVGQGDALLLKTENGKIILIDGGPDKKVIKELAFNLSFWKRDIDLVILTHPHEDHVAGLLDVLRRYKVKKILMTGLNHTSPSYLDFLKLIKEKDIETQIVKSGDIISLDNTELDILYPFENLLNKEVKDINNSSLAILIKNNGKKILTAGDNGVETENELIKKYGSGLKADILKISHHGSDTSSGEEFLKKVDPEYAVIEVGQYNRFGHPSLRVVRRLERKDIKILRTDQNGTIKFINKNGKLRLK